ncbi:hypothetical protein H2199_001425 [Coniosporium tulheliwenetii]|uniref:Uncharacterized protein n=1 Tax=Coniosporium tulheliwenetii TaxID=3383036 RepID=A0ACC2ZM40_9PEZI|nr:hypothetical protein H2199_001425 [Cladosporium sp. JES 115]
MTCAWSGAFLIAGGLAVDVWNLLGRRARTQILLQRSSARLGVTAALFTATVTFTGFSMRFGDACHVNSVHSMKDFWGPLLGIAAASTLTQLATFAYCIHVYLKNMWSEDKTDTNSSCGLPSYSSSVNAQSARAVYRRVKKVILLQWRGIAIVICILVDVVFFSTVFVYLDNMEHAVLKSPEMLQSWLLCLVASPNDRAKCFHLGQEFLINQPTVVAVLLMLSMAGIQAFFLLGRWSMFTAWVKFLRTKLARKREFVSLDARRCSADARAYELLKLGTKPTIIRSPETEITSPADTYASPISGGRSGTPDYFAKDVHRHYRSPNMSFSSPTTPNQMALRVDWDPRSTHARGGLGLHPPISEDSSPISPEGFKHKL